MKKIVSLATSLCMLASALPLAVSAEEFENYPAIESFKSIDAWDEAVLEGINDGKYFADFDGNGKFNPVDVFLIMEYYISVSMMDIDAIDWDGQVSYIDVLNDFSDGSYFGDYSTIEDSGATYLCVDINNEIFENIKKYGDVNEDGHVDAADAAMLLEVYLKNFSFGDVNMDNYVDATDASCVLQYYSGKSTGESYNSYTTQFFNSLGDMDNNKSIDASDASDILEKYAELSVKK